MGIQINLNTDELSECDINILAAIYGGLGGTATTVVGNNGAGKTDPAVAAEAAKLAEKVATKPPAKKAAATKPAVEADPEPEPEADEDLVGGDDDGEYTKDAAVKKATELMAAGKAKVIKAALVEVGASKVGQLEDAAQIKAWFDALDES